MTTYIFEIRRALLIPFGICAGLLVCLLVLSLLGEGSALERIALVVITMATATLFLIARNRRITITDQGILIRKLFKTKEIHQDDISHVGCVILRKRIYLLLTTTKGFIILSNAYEDFSAIIRNIVEKVGPEKAEEEVRALGKSAANNPADIMSLWFAVVVISGLIILKLSSM